jgi:hypothetical protein
MPKTTTYNDAISVLLAEKASCEAKVDYFERSKVEGYLRAIHALRVAQRLNAPAPKAAKVKA